MIAVHLVRFESSEPAIRAINLDVKDEHMCLHAF